MAPRCSGGHSLFLPFLYPPFFLARTHVLLPQAAAESVLRTPSRRHSSTHVAQEPISTRLNPGPDDYAAPSFADKAQLTLYAGGGGNGCISFLRDLFLPEGPPNGGDGGHGGNIYIQAVHGETSLHKLARRRFVRADRGKNGQGSAKSGQRGEDVIITVPVGTVLRELSRVDPVAENAMRQRAAWFEKKMWKARKRERDAEAARRELENPDAEDDDHITPETIRQLKEAEEEDDPEPDDPNRDKWLVYPGASKTEVRNISFPRLRRRERLFRQPPAPLHLDLSRPTPTPILLAAGGIGGLGNPHFVSREHPRPIFATKGERAVSLEIELELKLLADVGLVGLPNAGKSTLLRALTNSRARVGSWAFTTLQPNIGTVVLDSYKGRPVVRSYRRYPSAVSSSSSEVQDDQTPEHRTRFTVADIPGLIEGAHLDKGLGIAFLRHVERAGVLAFVIDLSAGDAVAALKALWREVGLYAQMREDEDRVRAAEASIDWDLDTSGDRDNNAHADLARDDGPDMLVYGAPPAPERVSGLHIAGKPWFVVATKGDLPDTQENFRALQAYLEDVGKGAEPHPSGIEDAWIKRCTAIPVSAINGHGVDRIVHWTVGLLDD
ncbi:GTP-binding protein [Sodiomyces alkalinus F11]|uniref:GTP-binding protein n=1 Tax=Sodiomyces alkalinus (strain CBS 110278 / VKM F-3762 / F11) TaxID=1314773 RepID=A0A3N2Q1M9_SODAK|nr:GTP-binding protein [Sodiomyces alkalinus F11]ROT40673.1 GTP-binding protein [Sodiomyces alkalinus F11]